MRIIQAFAGIAIAFIVFASPALAAEVSLPIKVGGDALSLDTGGFDAKTLIVLGVTAFLAYQWYTKRKADPAADAVAKLPQNIQSLVQALLSLWGRFPAGGKPKSLDVTINFESGEPYTFHVNLGGRTSATAASEAVPK